MKLYKKHDWNKKYLIENIEEIKGSTRVIIIIEIYIYYNMTWLFDAATKQWSCPFKRKRVSEMEQSRGLVWMAKRCWWIKWKKRGTINRLRKQEEANE